MGDKKLGKISEAKFGVIHDMPFLFGLKLEFNGDDWSVGCSNHVINMSKECKWKGDRKGATEEIMDFTYKLLKEAKVQNVNDLFGIPVEVEFEGNTFKDFRILTEVL